MTTKKLFQVTLYEKQVLITTSSNRVSGFEGKVRLPESKELKIIDRNGMQYDWINTKPDELSYPEVCGVLKLFGIVPPTFSDLCSMLKIRETSKF